MAPLADAQFLVALLRSPTFAASVGGWLAGGLCCALVALLLLSGLARRMRRRSVLADESGAASAIDFTLTFPLVWFFTACVVQFALLANGAVIVHYAAYSAARSARVHSFLYDNAILDYEARIGRPWIDPVNLGKRVEQAARMALIAASTADSSFEAPPLAPDVARIVTALAAAAGDPGRAAPLLRKAAYAFDPRNARVEYSRPDIITRNCSFPFGVMPKTTAPNGCNPVWATVEFRLPLTIPGGRVLADECGEDACYKLARATVGLI